MASFNRDEYDRVYDIGKFLFLSLRSPDLRIKALELMDLVQKVRGQKYESPTVIRLREKLRDPLLPSKCSYYE